MDLGQVLGAHRVLDERWRTVVVERLRMVVEFTDVAQTGVG